MTLFFPLRSPVMNFSVFFHVSDLSEAPVTNITKMRFFSGVSPSVEHQLLRPPESFFAIRTRIRATVRMHGLVILQGIFRFERFPAFVANERPFVGMARPIMLPFITIENERFPA